MLSHMGIGFVDAGIYVVTSPKVLSTSLKMLAFELENEKPFEPYLVEGRKRQIHNLYPTRRFQKVSRKKYPIVVCFFRDPLERFVSMYKNRVLRKHPGTAHLWEDAQKNGLDPLPSLEDFATNLRKYRRLVREVEHHSEPQVFFTGRRPEYYDHIFLPETAANFERLLSDNIGREVSLPRAQASPSTQNIDISSSTERAIRYFYRKDYKFAEWQAKKH